MAITEVARNKIAIEKTKEGIELCEQAIAKAEKYERLNELKDWKDFWNDLDPVIEKHRRDIEQGAVYLTDAPNTTLMGTNGEKISSKADWTDFIREHVLQKVQLESWKKEPARLIAMANLCREKLPQLKDSLAELESKAGDENGSER